jgi:NTP pyrophosphatase (non-canonical NTP hydrolase)
MGAATALRFRARLNTFSAMTLDEYQLAAARTLNQQLTAKERLLDAAAGLAEESGEILGVVRKHVYQSRDLKREQLTTELGDALWCLAMTAASAGIALEDVAAANVAKLRSRYPDGYSDAASRERRT